MDRWVMPPILAICGRPGNWTFAVNVQWQQETERKAMKRLAIIAGASCLASGLGVLLGDAVWRWIDARRERWL